MSFEPNDSQRNARIAQLRAEMKMEEDAKARKIKEVKMKEQLTAQVVRAVEKVEQTLEQQIKSYDDVENMGDEELDILRERRLKMLKENALRNEKWKALGHGEYRTITDEKEFFAQAKQSERLVVHFGRNATRRCEILDGHLTNLARKHIETKFVRIEAERCVFLADRLKISVLPSIVLVKNGKTDHTLVGFEEFGGEDDFPTEALENVLVQYKIITQLGDVSRFGKKSNSVRKGNVEMNDWED